MAKIKIIDDDIEIVHNTSLILSAQGYDVSALYTTEGALQTLVCERPDILILDVMFPENPVAGFDLARLIRREPEIRDVPIILLSGINTEFPMDFSTEDVDPDWMPVQEFIEKPAEPSHLIKTIEEMLAL